MAKQVQFRRGTTSQHSSFTGAVGEITVDTDKDTVVVHDGSTAGGHPLVKQLSDLSITATATELNYNDITTLGTVEASKVVTADANGDVTFPDGEKLKLGTGGDLQVYHDGSSSYIRDDGTGSLYVQGSDLILEDPDGNNYIYCADDSAVYIYHNGSTKLSTTATGADVTGELIADSYNETYAAVTSSSNATTVNCHNGNAFSHTLTENTTFTFSNPPASGTAYSFSIEIIQDASASGYTVTWPAAVDWPSATAVFYTRDGGTNWYGFTAGQALG
jgi:hypothetical protein